jgi:hypothetical protein
MPAAVKMLGSGRSGRPCIAVGVGLIPVQVVWLGHFFAIGIEDGERLKDAEAAAANRGDRFARPLGNGSVKIILGHQTFLVDEMGNEIGRSLFASGR